jgi:hypothetical protein
VLLYLNDVVKPKIGATGVVLPSCSLTSHCFNELHVPQKPALFSFSIVLLQGTYPSRLVPLTFSDARSPLHDTNWYTAPEEAEQRSFFPYSESPL